MALSLPLVTRAISSRSLPKHAFFCSRRFSTVDKSATESWASDLQKKSLILDDQFNHAHLEQLYATLPTRRGRDLSRSPTRKATLPYGFHLAFFGGSKPEADLRPDGTDPEFSPPAPFARRVWAGGRMEWPDVGNGAVRKDASATVEVTDVRLRGFETDNPIVFVDQRWNVRYTVYDECSLVTETRTHAYLPQGTTQRPVKQVANLPAQVDFSFSYTPTPTTLFRFSALTFNGHYIHLNRHYAKKEKYEERLVHGPLNALMMLETVALNSPARLRSFEYRAVNPVVVNRPITINGKWNSGAKLGAKLWIVQDDVVGMTGSVDMYP